MSALVESPVKALAAYIIALAFLAFAFVGFGQYGGELRKGLEAVYNVSKDISQGGPFQFCSGNACETVLAQVIQSPGLFLLAAAVLGLAALYLYYMAGGP